MEPFLVQHFLERVAGRRPESPLLIDEGVRSSYSDVDAGANRFARLLGEHGVRRGDRVGLLAQNGRPYVEAYYGILKAGGVAVPLNTAADAASLAGMLGDCGARALVASGPRFERTVERLASGLADRFLLVVPDPARLATPAAVTTVALDAAAALPGTQLDTPSIDLDLAAIVYTSGSTGRPRGAMLSHLNLVSNTRSIVGYLGLRAEDRVLAVLPFYYVYGKSLLNTHSAAGGTVVIENRFVFPDQSLDTLDREACTGLAGVPSTFAILLNRSSLARRPLPSLRYVTQAGGPMAPELTRQLMAALPGRRVFVMYGATEASARLSYLDPADLPRKVGSIGKAIPNVELRVLRDDGTEADVGETGELVARGANVMRGYWGEPEETARVIDDAGYHTGDLARRDEDGFLWIVGRRKDMIKTGAHRIAPQEIEDAILECADVHEAAVIGVPDETLGEAIKAFVVLLPGAPATTAPIEALMKRRLPPFKRPASYEVVDELPKNEAGKVMKQALRGR